MTTNEFLSDKWLAKLTMTDGTYNDYWNEIAAKIKKIETLATDLRCELEELADNMEKPDVCFITDEYGDCEGIDSYNVQDWANMVAEIESNFELDE